MMNVFSRAFFLLQIKIENNRFSYHPRNTYFVQLSPSSAIFTFCKTKIIGLSANLKFFFSHKLRQESNYLQRFSRNKYFDHNGKKHSFEKKKNQEHLQIRIKKELQTFNSYVRLKVNRVNKKARENYLL